MASILIRQGPQILREIQLYKASLDIGRSSECEIQLVDRSVSRNHARISQVNGLYYVEDLGGKSGVILNALKVQREPLQHRDKIIIPPFQLEFLADGKENPEPAEAVVEVESVILVTRCLALDGTATIPLIQVLSNPPDEPTPTPTATPTLTSTPAPVSVILPNCYKITFLGFADNGDGTSTWNYQVDELSCAQDLSNWVLELPACTTFVGASPSPWEAVHLDPNLHLIGIKCPAD